MDREQITTPRSKKIIVEDDASEIIDHHAAVDAEDEAVTTYADGGAIARGTMQMFNSAVGLVL